MLHKWTQIQGNRLILWFHSALHITLPVLCSTKCAWILGKVSHFVVMASALRRYSCTLGNQQNMAFLGVIQPKSFVKIQERFHRILFLDHKVPFKKPTNQPALKGLSWRQLQLQY